MDAPHDEPRYPLKALAAMGSAILLIVVFWQFKVGAWALLFLPVMALYVANVYLGGGLNDPPLDGIRRIRPHLERRR
jgi:hypothetical protein